MCALANVKFAFQIEPQCSLNISAIDSMQVTCCEPRWKAAARALLVSELKWTLSLGFCQAALNLAAAFYLLYVLAGVSLLNEGEQDCLHPEDSTSPAPQDVMDNVGICIRVCEQNKNIHVWKSFLHTRTQAHTPFAQ